MEFSRKGSFNRKMKMVCLKVLRTILEGINTTTEVLCEKKGEEQ